MGLCSVEYKKCLFIVVASRGKRDKVGHDVVKSFLITRAVNIRLLKIMSRTQSMRNQQAFHCMWFEFKSSLGLALGLVTLGNGKLKN